jgi:Zn-dependent alcohol dehydrogenase
MSQKALIVQEIGKPAVLTQKPIASPKENEVLVKVVVAGSGSIRTHSMIHPLSRKLISSSYL